MKHTISGLHHITAIAANAKKNLDFYTGVLGLRLVKKTVNFDDPGTYHFYYGDGNGTPGTILTFFPWEGIGAGKAGAGMATDIAYSVPEGSLDFWLDRFKKYNVTHGELSQSFGETYLPFEDPDGLRLRLVVPSRKDERLPWETAEVKAATATRGFHSVVLTLQKTTGTAEILTEIFGYQLEQQENNRYRYRTDAVENASVVDLVELPDEGHGINAAGTNHHIAFRVKDEDTLMAFRDKIVARGLRITPKIDRDYFFSLYFREPGGVLFEIATDNPGFATDETVEKLGTSLRLPKQHEHLRKQIEATLPKLD